LLQRELVSTANDPTYARSFNFNDDGQVFVKPEYLLQLRTQYGDDQVGYQLAVKDLNDAASYLTAKMRALLTSAEAAADVYDWKVETALLGETDETRPYLPMPPDALRPRAEPKVAANKNGSGPDQYNTERPNAAQRAYLLGVYESARAGAKEWERRGGKIAPRMMNHFLDGSGDWYQVDVSQMKRDLPKFAAKTKDDADAGYRASKAAMPDGYKGPVAFQTEWTSFRPSATHDPDYWAGLGRFSSQESGVVYTDSKGVATLATKTSIYDYYNWDTTDPKPWPQASDLGRLDRAGMAQNFDSVGSDTTYRKAPVR